MKILKFYGVWCQPCKVLGKNLTAAEITTCPIDVDNNEDLVEKYNIKSVPTLVVVDDNEEEITRLVGTYTKEELLDKLKDYI